MIQDCSPARLGFVEAFAAISARVLPLGCEAVASHAASGRILAERVFAQRDHPPFDMAAMDGFAVAREDAGGSGERRLRLGAPQFAGDRAEPLACGAARPIYTGAEIPPGAAAVLVQERARIAGASLLLAEPLADNLNIRSRGEDARCGECIAPAGLRVNPAIVGALCSFGIAEVRVRRMPRVALVTTGAELAPVGTAAGGAVIDANGPMIAALLAEAGCLLTERHHVADDEADLRACLAGCRASGVDIIVTTGGASVGARDLVRGAVEASGGAVHFHGVHMRPGKPVLFASHAAGPLVFGLPGNPAAALVAARFFLLHAVRGLQGREAEAPLTLLPVSKAGDGWSESGPTRVLKARMSGYGADARVEVLPGQQSHRLRPLLEANAWLVTGGGLPARLFPLFDHA